MNEWMKEGVNEWMKEWMDDGFLFYVFTMRIGSAAIRLVETTNIITIQSLLVGQDKRSLQSFH